MRRFGWVALWAALAACPGGKQKQDAGVVDAGPAQLSEREPNDRPDQALALSGSTQVTAALSADPTQVDEDWYLLSADAPKTVDLSVTGIPGGDVTLEVMDSDRNRLAAVNSGGEGKPERLPNLAVQGKALVKVTTAKRGAGGSYTLTALFLEPVAGSELEPNDRAVDATGVVLGESISGYLGHTGDEDWFRFEVPQPDGGTLPAQEESASAGATGEGDAGQPAGDAGVAPDLTPNAALKIELTGVEGVRFDLSVLSAAEAPLFQVKGKDGEGLSLRNVGVRSTDRVVYVVVKSAWTGTGKEARRTFNPDAAYKLTVAEEEAGASAEYEPNDELRKATVLPASGYREGFISPKGDVDYFVLRTDQPMLAKVQLSGVERVDLVLSLVKPAEESGAEQVLMKVNDGEVKEPELVNNVFCEGECWFKVEGGSRKVDGKWVRDFENAEQAYRLAVNVIPDNGGEEREPNGAVEGASPIAIGRPVRGTVHPKRDSDYFKLDLSARPVKTPVKATLLGILKVDVGLYLHRVGEDGKLELVQTADRAKGEAPEVVRYSADPGVYVFEVRDAKNREANFQDAYQLTVEEAE